MDIADKTENDIETILGAAVNKIRQKKHEPFVNYKQLCLFCGEPVESTEHKFCCKECAEDYAAEKEALRRKGEL
jgi:predicted nucleic acid-binding Zn ribbon protein